MIAVTAFPAIMPAKPLRHNSARISRSPDPPQTAACSSLPVFRDYPCAVAGHVLISLNFNKN
jgi:hypothetical protein